MPHPHPDVPQARRLRTALPGPRSLALAARRNAAVSRGVASTLPVYAAAAGGGTLTDVDGNVLIDFGSGIAVTSVGAADPNVVAAVRDQVERMTHTCFMVTPYEGYVAVCEWLAELTPGDHDKRSVLVNSGSEALENAVKVARVATGRDAIVVLDHAYHGRTTLTMAMTAKAKPYKEGFGPFAPEVYRVPTSYPLRDPEGMTGAEAAVRTIATIERLVGADQVAAIVAEPIQGEGGFIVPAAGFHAALAAWAAEHGVLIVADEVQSGFCRTGRWFASEHVGLVPDIVTTAKALGGGLPIAGVTGRAEVMDAVQPGGLGGTYGGNPVACAAALATIEVMRSRDLAGAARTIESITRTALEPITRLPAVAELRGHGAMLALELVRPGGLEPDPGAAKAIAHACHQRGLLLLTCGSYGNVVRLLPPLVIDEHLLREGLGILAEVIAEVTES